MNYQLRAEPNIYYQHPLADTIASQSTSPITHDQYSSRDETQESSGTQQNDTSNIIGEQAIIRKQMKKLKMSFIIAVTTIIAFLVALAIISLVLLASRRDCQAQQRLVLPDIVIRVVKEVVSLQGNISMLKNQIDTNSEYLNEYAHQTQALNNNISEKLNEYAHQTQELNNNIYIRDAAHPATSANDIIAYRPYFNDSHNSNTAILFFNLEAAFPCLRNTLAAPACTLFSLEEDSFLGGRSLIQAADIGNDFRIFSQNQFINTFGFGFVGCSTFDSSCVPNSFERSLVCLLPSSVCT